MAVANCPGCGGPIDFKVGSSVVIVCDYCRSLVARTDRGLEDLGKIAALVDTGSPLRRDLPGRYHNVGFRLVGRTQLKHPMGGVWDEWYAAFDDGRWGWLAEAQGRYYVTFKTAAEDVPPLKIIQTGGTYRSMVITEISEATVISGEGEMPWKPDPGVAYDYADLSGANNRFATIDYSEEPPLLFAGEQTSLKDIGINVNLEPARKTKVSVDKLSCSRCGGPLTLLAPEASERIVCPNCGAAHDIGDGNLQYLESARQKPRQLRVPLGKKGTIDGHDYLVAGYMERYVTVDGDKYFWSEYLLFEPKAKAFAWLVDSEDHWSYVLPLNAGDVEDASRNDLATTLRYDGKTFRVFADAPATVSYVAGEFYWKVEVGEGARAIDYIAPPLGISKELTAGGASEEINYSLSRYMAPEEVEAAFSVSGLPRPTTVGMTQPIKSESYVQMWLMLFVALLGAAIIIGIHGWSSEVFKESFNFDQVGDWSDTAAAAAATDASSPRTPGTGVVFTKPFTLKGGKTLEIEGYSAVENAWVYVGGDLFNEQSGMIESFDLPMEYYHGVDGGESWNEGSRTKRAFLSAVPAGTYTLRLEGQWEPNKTPPAVMIRLQEGSFRWRNFWIAFVLITVPPFILLGRRGMSEAARWNEAMFTPAGTRRSEASADDDDDDE